MTVTDEQTLPDALDRLYAAVGGLVDPRKELMNGAVLAAPSRYEELLDALPAKAGEHGGRSTGRSVPPVWCDAVDLRTTIDARVKSWQPQGQSTPGRLRALASRRFRPQDVRQVREYAADVSSFTVSITALLHPAHVKTIAAPCPACSARYYYRSHAGEQVRTAALQVVAETGCTCQKCGAFWEPARYLFLCRLLGFDLPTGVLE